MNKVIKAKNIIFVNNCGITRVIRNTPKSLCDETNALLIEQRFDEWQKLLNAARGN